MSFHADAATLPADAVLNRGLRTEHVGDIADEFRGAMRRCASSVAVLTACRGHDVVGMTATSLMSVALEPAVIAFAAHKGSGFQRAYLENQLACVNVLASAQTAVARAFSSGAPYKKRFAVGNWVLVDEHREARGHRSTPVLADAQANILCRPLQAISCGTHTLFVSEVLRTCSAADGRPLIYHDGAYRSLCTGNGPACAS